ncbi:branched-chain amino acid ABC transporter permease [Neotabrizicola sp. VNH66]|uniref:branched-chain amino acid ABC transporter permease n=1 Tax=Neotabrizicola sp. VNH66 TaxID=3400918 RepID=UPI003C078739
MDLFLQLLVNGLINGSHYALLGIGFGLIFSTTGIVHFAYGSVYTFAAYVAWFTASAWGFSLLPAMAAAILGAVILGVLCYTLLYRPLELRRAPPLIPLIASLGLNIALENLNAIIFGSGARTADFGSSVMFLGPVFFTTVHIWQVVSCAVILAALVLFLRKTRYGRAILAMTDDPHMARVVGIDTQRISYLVFALGSAVSAVAATLILMKDGASTHMGFIAVFMGFVAVIVGGVGSLKGVVAGGFLLGIVESLGLWKISTEWQSSIAFIVLFIMIMLRPQGLFSIARR